MLLFLFSWFPVARIGTFYCSQCYITFRYKDIYTHRVVLKTTVTASQCSKGNSPVMVCLKTCTIICSSLGRKSEFKLCCQIARGLLRSRLNDKPVYSLTKMIQQKSDLNISPAFSTAADSIHLLSPNFVPVPLLSKLCSCLLFVNPHDNIKKYCYHPDEEAEVQRG